MKFDREAFVDECRRALAEDAQQLAVREVVERLVADPAGVESELGVADGWRIDVLYNDEDLTIMHFVWPPLVDLFPHQHKMWSTVGIYGGGRGQHVLPAGGALDRGQRAEARRGRRCTTPRRRRNSLCAEPHPTMDRGSPRLRRRLFLPPSVAVGPGDWRGEAV